MSSVLLNLVRNFSLKMPFYSVARGRQTGVFLTWPECESHVKGFNRPIFKKFNTRAEAEKHCLDNGGQLAGGGGSAAANSASPANKLETAKPTGFTAKRSLSTSALGASPAGPAKRTKLIDLPTPTADVGAMKKYGELAFLEDADGYVQVYTDGSCEGNGTSRAIAGLGVNTAKPVSGRATNNCGEIQAASEAIRLARQHGISKLCINTDSQFVINAVTKWLPGWIRKGWLLASGQPVKNVIDFKELHELLLKHKELKIKWTYVKAHCGILGNERADALAKQGGQMYKERSKAQ